MVLIILYFILSDLNSFWILLTEWMIKNQQLYVMMTTVKTSMRALEMVRKKIEHESYWKFFSMIILKIKFYISQQCFILIKPY